MFARCLLLVSVLISLAGCTGGIGAALRPSVVPEPSVESPILPTEAPPTPTGELESTIKLVGKVMDVSLSARIILLEQESQGFRLIALSPVCEPVSTGGEPLALRDVRPGVTVQASGRPGESGALIATDVLVVLPESTPVEPEAGSSEPVVGADDSDAPEAIGRDVERIRFAEGMTQTVVTGTLAPDGVACYIFRATAGQRMILKVGATRGGVRLGLAGDDGQVLLSGRVAGDMYDGVVATTQEYTVIVGAIGGSGADYTLTIELSPPRTAVETTN